MSEIGPDGPRLKPMDISEQVHIKLPAFIWMQFLSSYSETEWNSAAATMIAFAVRDAMFDPIYLSEQDAQYQEHQDQIRQQHAGIFNAFGIQPRPPDDPRIPG